MSDRFSIASFDETSDSTNELPFGEDTRGISDEAHGGIMIYVDKDHAADYVDSLNNGDSVWVVAVAVKNTEQMWTAATRTEQEAMDWLRKFFVKPGTIVTDVDLINHLENKGYRVSVEEQQIGGVEAVAASEFIGMLRREMSTEPEESGPEREVCPGDPSHFLDVLHLSGNDWYGEDDE